MFKEKALVLYKNRPAIVSGFEADKININVPGGESVKVREKDIELIHPGPCALSDLTDPVSHKQIKDTDIREAWELLADNENINLKELAEIAFGEFNPVNAWAAWKLVAEGLYFTGSLGAIKARTGEQVREVDRKREEKEKEAVERTLFYEKIKKLLPYKMENAEAIFTDSEKRFFQDLEALAKGQSDKSRTLKELGRQETPEEAHRLLLAAGVWTLWDNPHPFRQGFGSISTALKSIENNSGGLNIPPEDRLDLTALAAYAIDSSYSDDPDDAVSLEGPDSEGNYCLWVHVADPASIIIPGSPIDIEAREKGASLYLPEGVSRMINPEITSLFSLGYSGKLINGKKNISPALSFKIIINSDLTIKKAEVHPSMVNIERISFEEADELIFSDSVPEDRREAHQMLSALYKMAEGNVERRLDTGAVMIDMPEVHISVKPRSEIIIEPYVKYRSAEMIRECMIWAGEGAARWAMENKIAIPFLSQEAGELPNKRLSDLAGAYQIRRSMRPRLVSIKPGVHWGLGLDQYTQVTSPLRRYTDLLCHQQFRAFLGTAAYREIKPLTEDEVLLRIGASEAAVSSVGRADRASKVFWTMVYLADKKDTVWKGILLENRGSRGVVFIPALGLETQININSGLAPNDEMELKLLSVKIPEGEAVFSSL